MALDTSIYQNLRPVQIESPDIAGSIQKGMTLSNLAMQNQQQQQALQTNQAVKALYSKHTGMDGQLNQQGFLSDLAKINPQSAMEYQQHFAKMGKENADAKAAQADAAQKMYSVTGPAFDYMAKMPEAQRAAAYPQVIKQLASQGIDVSHMDHPYDPQAFNQYYGAWQQNKDKLASVLTQANTVKSYAETDKARADADKARSETIQKTPESLAGGDPAKLIAGRVPKDLQAKAFEEVKSAKEINALAPKIEAAFQMASSRNPNTSANGKKDLAALLYTTVKETEGTSRKQAFDAIDDKMIPSGLLARPGENETKLKTIQNYLQSKSSYPITGGHGIELAKYPSTAPYQMGAKQQGVDGGGSGGAINSAFAGQGQMTAQDAQALQWAKDPKNASSPDAFSIRAKLKAKGIL